MAEDNDKVARLPRAFVPDLTTAVRRAEIEERERTRPPTDWRVDAIARLEALRLALAPLFAQTGSHIGAFDHGLVPGEAPKLFIDMAAYVDCGHDRMRYRLVQDSYGALTTLAESERAEPIIDAITVYVARRIVERERAMALNDKAMEARDAAIRAANQPPPARPAETPVAKSGHLGEALTLFICGAMFGAAAYYALSKLLN